MRAYGHKCTMWCHCPRVVFHSAIHRLHGMFDTRNLRQPNYKRIRDKSYLAVLCTNSTLATVDKRWSSTSSANKTGVCSLIYPRLLYSLRYTPTKCWALVSCKAMVQANSHCFPCSVAYYPLECPWGNSSNSYKDHVCQLVRFVASEHKKLPSLTVRTLAVAADAAGAW